MFSFSEKTTQMNNAQANSINEMLERKHDSIVDPYPFKPTESLFGITSLFSVCAATSLTLILTLGPVTVCNADWNETEDDEERSVVEQFINEQDDSGSPYPVPDEADLDEMEDQGELEGYYPEEAEQ
ncbi:hypothetical protein [Endozoicomonas numazuensis]|uniref:Uncharacterized protein n=1 Tax=Endozoicomonas numazuensis TaxID=1137799 RepID=A0A081NG23_9GAMM|nr:hypothetical protein [Endozoicomonas numazuensis]KEQ17396.1 hypothetical protein GZ78_16515 [Endozoicomonas numazuensis]